MRIDPARESARTPRSRAWMDGGCTSRACISSDSRRLSRAASHAPARGLRVLTPIQQRAGKEKRGQVARDRSLPLPERIGNTLGTVERGPRVLLPSAGVLATRVRFLYRRVDCRIHRGLQGRKRTEWCWREGR